MICKVVLISLAVFGFSGCTTKMALDASKGSRASLRKLIGIFTLSTENAYKPSYEPEVAKIKLVSNTSHDEKAFVPNKPHKQGENEYLEYLVSVDLDPGAYSLKQVEGGGQSFLISGQDDPEPKSVVPARRGVVEAERRTAARAVVEPTALAKHAVRARSRANRVSCSSRISPIPVMTPLRHIPMHVVNGGDSILVIFLGPGFDGGVSLQPRFEYSQRIRERHFPIRNRMGALSPLRSLFS